MDVSDSGATGLSDRLSRYVRRYRGTQYGLAALLAPSLLFIFVFMLLPTLVLINYSFQPFEGGQILTGFTLAHYERGLLTSLYQEMTIRTVKIALIVTVVNFLLGYPLAYVAVRKGGWVSKLIVLSTLMPLTIDLVIRSFGWYVLLQSNGVIPSGLVWSGLFTTETVPKLMFNELAIIIGLSHVHLPFMVFPLISVIHTIPEELEEAARNMGANRLTVFLRILFPLSLPGISAGVLITFVLSMAAYVTPKLLGGGVQILPITVTDTFVRSNNWPFGSALSMVLVALGLVAILSYYRILMELDQKGGI
jgi:ABC-type spermidine/putrescine transport system permease subunit I